MIPVAFGISFTKLPMNQAGALVHIYLDGSVLVSTGAVEMGQQVGRKIALIVAKTLGVPVDMVTVQRTTTLTVANTVPTAASTGSDINGMAAQIACREIRGRLIKKATELLGVRAEDIDIVEGHYHCKWCTKLAFLAGAHCSDARCAAGPLCAWLLCNSYTPLRWKS